MNYLIDIMMMDLSYLEVVKNGALDDLILILYGTQERVSMMAFGRIKHYKLDSRLCYQQNMLKYYLQHSAHNFQSPLYYEYNIPLF